MKRFLYAFSLVLFIVPFSRSVGSLSTEDISPLLKQNAELFDLISSTLDLAPGAAGSRIGQSVNERLGGARVAPYYLLAKPKGATDWVFDMRVDADVTYLDANGAVTDLFGAYSYREALIGITLEIRKKEPNQSPDPTPTAVTPDAHASVAPAAGAGHL